MIRTLVLLAVCCFLPPAAAPSAATPTHSAAATPALTSSPTHRSWTGASPAPDPGDPGTTLDNGLRVTLVPYGTEKRATVRLTLEAGTAYEAPSETGLADVTARWLALRSLRSSPGALRLDVEVRPDVMVFSADVAASAVPGTLRRFGELAANTEAALTTGAMPDEAVLDSARAATAQSRSSASSPQADARAELRRILYDNSTYGPSTPSPQQIRSFTAADVRSFLDRFVAPSRAALYVVGSFRSQEVRDAAERHLGSWSATPAGQALRAAARTPKTVHVVDRADRAEAAIALGTTVVGPGHADYAALQVATQIIGGGHASRLAQSPELTAASSPYSLLSPHRASTYWAAVVTTRPTQTRPVLQTVRRILTTLRTTPPDTAAVQRAATVLVDRFLMQSSTRDGLSEQMMFLHRHNLSTDYFMTYESRLRSVTPTDVQRVVNRYLAPKHLAVVVTGPAKLIKPQVAPMEKQVP